MEDCPLGFVKCQNKTVKYVLSKIIDTVVEQEKKEDLKNEDNKTSYSVSPTKKTRPAVSHVSPDVQSYEHVTKKHKLKFSKHYRNKQNG